MEPEVLSGLRLEKCKQKSDTKLQISIFFMTITNLRRFFEAAEILNNCIYLIVL